MATSERISYSAKGFVSGLTDVIAKVYNPDASIVEVPLMELANEGVYYFDYILKYKGTYTFIIDSVSNPWKVVKTLNV